MCRLMFVGTSRRSILVKHAVSDMYLVNASSGKCGGFLVVYQLPATYYQIDLCVIGTHGSLTLTGELSRRYNTPGRSDTMKEDILAKLVS